MKILLSLLLVAFTTVAFAGEAEWKTNYADALKQAKKENKKVFLNFTGSDWCPWCIKLKKEVFEKPEFSDFAKKNLVLVEVDFPRSTSLPKDLQKQNEKLQKEYSIEGFPTLILLDSNGKQLRKQAGVPEGGASSLIKWIQLSK